MFEVNTMNGSCVIAKTAGIESTANTTSLTSTRSGLPASGVAKRRPSRRTKKRVPSGAAVTGKTRCKSRTTGFRSGRILLVAQDQQLGAGDGQDGTEDIHRPGKPVHESGSREDESRPHHQRAEDAPEEHLVLADRWHPERGEDHHEHEEVVDGEGLLQKVSGGEFQRPFRAEPGVDEECEGCGQGKPTGRSNPRLPSPSPRVHGGEQPPGRWPA